MKTEYSNEDLIDHAMLMIRPDGKGKATAIARIALAALTQPASPDLKLPDEMRDDDGEATSDSQMSWNACLAEVKRLNAPHTAPIEPICATGGAEWLKVSERMPPGKTGVLVAAEMGGPGDWRMKWATFVPGHPDADNGWLIPGASWTPTHWMPLPAAPEEK